jgi:hypothetical protein
VRQRGGELCRRIDQAPRELPILETPDCAVPRSVLGSTQRAMGYDPVHTANARLQV